MLTIGRRGLGRAVRLGVMLGLVGLAAAVALPPRSMPAEASAAPPACGDAAATERAALERAVACGRPVEVLDARTPWEALPCRAVDRVVGPLDGGRVAKVPVAVSGGAVTFTLDRRMLTERD